MSKTFPYWRTLLTGTFPRNVPIDYLKQVAEKHDNWLLNDDSNENVITIDVNHDFSDSERFKTTVIDRVSQLIKDNVSSMSSSSSEKSFDEMLSSMHC